VAGHCNGSQDAQAAWEAGDASLASGRNADGSDPGSVFADAEDIPVQIHAESRIGILGRPIGMRHAPLADIREAAVPNVDDGLIQSFDVVWRVRRAVLGLSQISEFFWP